MLQFTNDEQKAKIESILGKTSIWFSEDENSGLYIDDWISFDEMAEIVDMLRTTIPQKELFEECWVAYRRKGSKKKSLDYWKKLTDKEKSMVLAHVKAYVSSRELQYQKDFERYLRDKIFLTVVFQGNQVLYDPTKKADGNKEAYMPICGGALSWNDYYKCFVYVGDFNGNIADGYDDNSRPHGATITLNNGRGTITWNGDTKQWDKI